MHELLMQFLVSGPDFLWRRVWRTYYLNGVAQQAFDELDWENGAVRDRWSALDQPRERGRQFVGQPLWDALTDDVLAVRNLRDAFNARLRENHIRQLNSPQFRAAVNAVIPALLQRPVSQAIACESPFPAVWPLLANLLAAEVHHRTQPDFPETEWSTLQGLLLAGFFFTCRLPRASQVADVFREHRSVFLSVRSVFLRIPETIGPSGILDRSVPNSARNQGPVHLGTSSLCSLVEATALEASQTFNGNGPLHRMLPLDDPRHQPPIFVSVEHAHQLRSGRHTSYLLYEYTIVTFLALSAIEFLLRTWAQHINSNQQNQVAFFKLNGQPNGVLEWIDDLGCSANVLDSVRELYDPSRTNIRNRVLHGNLFEIHSKRMEVHLPAIDPRTYRWLAQDADSYHPENIARHCLHCLEQIDAEILQHGIVSADTVWSQSVMLTTEEIEFGHRVSCDFLGDNAMQWANTVSDYLVAVMPDLKQLFMIGFIGWIGHHNQLPPVTGMVMGFVYEAIHRLTVHLFSANVTGVRGGTIQKSHQQDRSISHFQYRMLDTRQDGLFSSPVLDRILEHVPVGDRQVARRVFDLAMKARNALAHGALVRADEYTLDGLGHIFAKAIQTLVTAGFHHFAREGAYFIHQNEHPNSDGHHDADWERAESAINQRIFGIAQHARWTRYW